MRHFASFAKAAAQIPWSKWGYCCASFLLLTQFGSATTWPALARLFAAMTMLVLLPFAAEMLNRKYLSRTSVTEN